MNLSRVLFLSALLAPAAALGAGPGTLAAEGLMDRGHRFIEAPNASAAGRYFAVSPEHTLVYGDGGVEVRFTRFAAGTKATNPPLRYSFAAAAPIAPQGVEASAVRYHWFVGAPENWATDLRSYREVAYRGVWPGIDAIYSGDRATLKYRFVVAPGADAAKASFVVSGAKGARLLSGGAIEWQVEGRRFVDDVPLAWQTVGSKDVPVPAAFTLEESSNGAWRVGFALAGYDGSREIVIDPAWLANAGLVGGNAGDQVYGLARDATGNAFACGTTASSDLPVVGIPNRTTTISGDNAFLAKFSPTGSALWVAYIGGNGFDVCTGVALGPTGRVFLTGGTTSTDFPFAGSSVDGRLRRTKAATDRDAFVTVFESTGSALYYSGVLGGSQNDHANAIAVDSAGRAYITGYASCVPATCGFPAVGGPSVIHGGDAIDGFGQDAFVARIGADGTTVEYAGFIGGNGGIEAGRGIAVAADFTAYVVGETDSVTGLPLTAGTLRTSVGARPALDAFVAKINPTGTLAALTLLTGSPHVAPDTGIDRALAIVIAPDGSLVVAGETDSQNFPANDANARVGAGPQSVLGGGMDGFVVRLASNLATAISASYLGGTLFDSAEAVAVDSSGNAYVTGTTGATGFPTAATPGLATATHGGQEGFVARFLGTTPGAFDYSGFVGSSSNEALHAAAIASAGDVLLLGGATSAPGTTFPGGIAGGLSAGASGANGLVVRLNDTPNVLSIVSGNGQTTATTANFALPLRVQLVDAASNPVAGVAIQFTAPGAGASATFPPTVLASATAITDVQGFAQVIAKANATVGSYSVTAQTPDGLSVSFSLTNVAPTTPGPPTLVSATPGNGTATLTFTPPAVTGGLPILSYAASCIPGPLNFNPVTSPATISGLLNGTMYTCAVTATTAGGTSTQSNALNVTPSVLPLLAVKSRKTHGAAGVFDLPVDSSQPITGAVSVESRQIGPGHLIVFQFGVPVSTAASVTVVDGLGVLVPAVNTAYVGSEAQVTIPALPDATRITVSLTNVNGTGTGASASLGFLVGDVNNSRSVTATDILQVKGHAGQATDGTNFKLDLNASGSITASDILVVKGRSGLVLP